MVITTKRMAHEHSGNYYTQGACYFGAWYEAVCSQSAWAHGHYGTSGIGSKCPVCGSPLVSGGPYYACQCSASDCGTISISLDAGRLSANIIKNENDTGVNDPEYEWLYKGQVVSTSASFMPIFDGTYTFRIKCRDGKSGAQITEEVTFNVTGVAEWKNCAIGDNKMYGMALGDTYIEHVAVGDTII